MHPTDRQLVDRFLATGEEEAFRLLFRRHTPRLYAMAYRLLGHQTADVDDAVQDTWQRAAVRLRDFEWRAALSTWLASILINCARERRRGRALELVEPDQLSSIPAGARPPGTSIDLERAVASLPDGYREVLVLHDVEGYTHSEIAGLLGIAVGTSKSQLFHARRAMRASLAPPTHEEINHAG